MKILIVSGFLGAGKTTFIQKMAQVTGREFVIYENEYAGTGIDTGRLEENSSLQVFESIENCVCCSGKADFAASVITIFCSLQPDYLIVEPTGMAKLSNIINNLNKIMHSEMLLLEPVLIIDALAFFKHKAAYPDIYLDQIKSSSKVFISKTDNLSPEELKAIYDNILEINPDARITSDLWSTFDISVFDDLLTDVKSRGTQNDISNIDRTELRWMPSKRNSTAKKSSASEEVAESNAVADQMDTLTFTDILIPSPSHLILFLNALSYGICGDITRAKGVIACGLDDSNPKEWLSFDFVENLWQMTGSSPADRSEFVIIGPYINKDEITKRIEPYRI